MPFVPKVFRSKFIESNYSDTQDLLTRNDGHKCSRKERKGEEKERKGK